MKRRDFCKVGAGTALAIGVGGLVTPKLTLVEARGSESSQIGKIYQLQAAFHRAKTTQDIELMMSLWDVNGILHVQGDPNSPYIGFDRLRSFWQNSGSFTHRRFSLVPSFKIQIDVRGRHAWLYFECHDIGEFNLANRFFATDSFLAGTIRRVNEDRQRDDGDDQDDQWVFREMTAGTALPLSVDHYYFP